MNADYYTHLRASINALKTEAAAIRRSGEVAPAGYSIHRNQTKTACYVSVDAGAEKAPFAGRNGSTRYLSLKKEGSEGHRNWKKKITRRDELKQIEDRALKLQEIYGGEPAYVLPALPRWFMVGVLAGLAESAEDVAEAPRFETPTLQEVRSAAAA